MKQLLYKFSFLVCALMLHFCGVSQIELKEYPRNYQFIPREGNALIGYDTVKIGISDTNSDLTLRIVVTQNSNNYYSKDYNFQAPVPSEILIPYEVPVKRSYNKVQLFVNNNNQPAFSSINVVAGDIIVVNGQSNAEATTVAASQDFDDFLRGFNSYTGNLQPGWQDLGRSRSGKWIGRTMNIISRQKDLPLGVIQIAKGGKPVKYFLPTDTSKHYQKSINIIKEAKALNKVRHFLWMQGESDGYGIGIQEYKDNLSTVIGAYLPNLAAEHVYAFQIIPLTCYGVSTNVAESQRRMHMYDDRITFLAATNSKLGADSCHFVYEDGYERMGDRMANLLLAEEYNTQLDHYLSPNVDSITTVDFKTITIHMSDTTLEMSGDTRNDFRISNSSALPINVEVVKNKIHLTYADPLVNGTKLSYVAHSNSELNYIFNKNGVGIFTFADFDIRKVAPPVLKCDESILLKSSSSTLLKGQQLKVIALHENKGPDAADSSYIQFVISDTSVLKFTEYQNISKGQFSSNNGLEWFIPQQSVNSYDSVVVVFDVLDDSKDAFVWSQIKTAKTIDVNSTAGNGTIGNVNENDEAIIEFSKRPCVISKEIATSNCELRQDSIIWKLTFSPDPIDQELSLQYSFSNDIVVSNYFPDSILLNYNAWLRADLKGKSQRLEIARSKDCQKEITITEPGNCAPLPALNLLESNELEVFPNFLTRGQELTVQSNTEFEQYYIYNSIGVQIKEQNITPSKEIQVNLNDLLSGMYFISTNKHLFIPFTIQ